MACAGVDERLDLVVEIDMADLVHVDGAGGSPAGEETTMKSVA